VLCKHVNRHIHGLICCGNMSFETSLEKAYIMFNVSWFLSLSSGGCVIRMDRISRTFICKHPFLSLIHQSSYEYCPVNMYVPLDALLLTLSFPRLTSMYMPSFSHLSHTHSFSHTTPHIPYPQSYFSSPQTSYPKSSTPETQLPSTEQLVYY
jgi:hypothetical protein